MLRCAACRGTIPDLDYAVFLLGRSRSFCPDVKCCEKLGPDIFFHRCAISIELALKAYLSQAGVIPDRLAACIGHDLRKAMECAQGFGLRPPAGWSDVLPLLHPHFMTRGFHREQRDWPAGIARPTRGVIADLLAQTRHAIARRKAGDAGHELLGRGQVGDREPTRPSGTR